MKRGVAFRIFLILALAAWSAGASVRAAAGLSVEICAADGPRTILLDLDGAPVADGSDCERCLLCAALASDGPGAAARPARSRARRAVADRAAPGRKARRGRRARAPPGVRVAPL